MAQKTPVKDPKPYLLVKPHTPPYKKGERNPHPREAWVHIQFIEWVENTRPDLASVMWHTPNGYRRGKKAARMLRLMGTKPGIPDILCLEPLVYKRKRYAGLALEIKRQAYTYPTRAQKYWLQKFKEKGWMTVVAHGLTSCQAIFSKLYPYDVPPVMMWGNRQERSQAVKTALEHDVWSQMSDHTIAAYCCTTQPFVSNMRKAMRNDKSHRVAA